MVTIRRYRSHVPAEHAAQYLRSHGIAAAVVGHHTADVLSGLPTRFSGIDVVILMDRQKARALELLDQMDDEPVELDSDWEGQAEPSEERLAQIEIEIHCANCGGAMRAESWSQACPACGDEVDTMQRIVEEHGPEALAELYEPPEPIELPDPESIDMPCLSCGYSLQGLPQRGRCPECGALYDKSELLQRFLR